MVKCRLTIAILIMSLSLGVFAGSKQEVWVLEDFESYKSPMDIYATGLTEGGPWWDAYVIQNLLKGNMNENDRAVLDTFSNDQLGVIYRFANNLRTQYGANDADKGLGGEGNISGSQDLTAERTKLFNEIQGLRKKPHKESEKMALIKRLTDLDMKIANQRKR